MPAQIIKKEERSGALYKVTYEEVSSVALTKEDQTRDIMSLAGIDEVTINELISEMESIGIVFD